MPRILRRLVKRALGWLGFVPASEMALSALEARVAGLERGQADQPLKDLIRYAMKMHWRTIDQLEWMRGDAPPSTCPLCGHRAQGAVFTEVRSVCKFLGGELIRHTCPACGVIFGPQKMFALDAEGLDLEYRNLYRIYSEGDSADSLERAFGLLGMERGRAYLDFGSGGGWSSGLARLRSKGWDVIGFEPSAENPSEHVLTSWEALESRRFHGIVSHNVLEHLFDPIGVNARLRRLLEPGGRIIHVTPCFEYRYDFTRFHVFFFTGRSPEVLARGSGMVITDWVRDGEFMACIMEPILPLAGG